MEIWNQRIQFHLIKSQPNHRRSGECAWCAKNKRWMLRLSSEDVHLFTDRRRQIKLIQFALGQQQWQQFRERAPNTKRPNKSWWIAIRTHKDGFETKRAPSHRNRCVLCAMIDTTRALAERAQTRHQHHNKQNMRARQSTADCVASTHLEYLLCASHACTAKGEWSPWDSLSAKNDALMKLLTATHKTLINQKNSCNSNFVVQLFIYYCIKN